MAEAYRLGGPVNFPEFLSSRDIRLFLNECKLAGYDVAWFEDDELEVNVGEGFDYSERLRRGQAWGYYWRVCYFFGDEDGRWRLGYVALTVPKDVTIEGAPALQWAEENHGVP